QVCRFERIGYRRLIGGIGHRLDVGFGCHVRPLKAEGSLSSMSSRFCAPSGPRQRADVVRGPTRSGRPPIIRRRTACASGEAWSPTRVRTYRRGESGAPTLDTLRGGRVLCPLSAWTL